MAHNDTMTYNDKDHINWRFYFTIDNQVKLQVAGENLLVTVNQSGECDDEHRQDCDMLSCLVDTGCVLDVVLKEEIVSGTSNDSQLFTVQPS